MKNEKHCFNNVYHKNDIKVLAPVPSYKETAKFKELLKECKCLFNRSTADGAEPNNEELIMILTKIEQALGEK